MKKILVIDDEPGVIKVIQTLLNAEGYDCLTASNGREGLTAFEFHRPDLIILDWQMPEMTGIDVCNRIRQSSVADPYILMLTGRQGPEDRLDGFSSGVDDYMTKPFKSKELAVRVRALLRRELRQEKKDEAEHLIETPRLRIDTGVFSVSIRATTGDKFVPIKEQLPTLEFNLLATLARHPGRVYSREDLLSAVWQDNFSGNDRVVDVYIRQLRNKLKLPTTDGSNEFIKTRVGTGYFFQDLPHET